MCADVIPDSPREVHAEDEESDIRLQLELDRLIKDELDATDLDICTEVESILSSVPMHRQLSSENPELELKDEVMQSNRYANISFEPSESHNYLQAQLSVVSSVGCEVPQYQQTTYESFHKRCPFPCSENPTVADDVIPRMYDSVLPLQCDEVDAAAFTNPIHYGFVSNNFNYGPISNQPAFSTPNLHVRSADGLATSNGHRHARSCTPVPSNISTPYQSLNLPLANVLGSVLSPQPDDNASPVRLSPIQTHCVDTIIGGLGASANLDQRNRECLIFEARGRQLKEAQEQIALLKEEITQNEQLRRHKEVIAQAEIENLSRELEQCEILRSAAEKKITELSETNSSLLNQLMALKDLKVEMEKKLADVEATNSTLSAELVQLSAGASLNLAKQRENNLTECLTRRHEMAEDVLRENLEISQRRISDKDDELASLRKDLEWERIRSREMATKHAEFVESLQSQLKSAQDRCSELSSSSLCVEVHELRQRIQDVLTSKKITDDINEILQEELRDVREQLSLYEQRLGISAFREIDVASLSNDNLAANTPTHQLPLFTDTGGAILSTVTGKPSLDRRRRRSCQSVSFATHLKSCENDNTLDMAKQQRPSSAVAAPLSSTWNNEVKLTTPDVLDAVSDNEMSPLTSFRRSTFNQSQSVTCANTHDQSEDYAPSKPGDSIASLKAELKATLISYQSKRLQITRLHEKLFAARCDLHKIVAERDRAEAARTDLQVRVLALEKELGLQGDARKPGPRETVLAGQLERLQTDYSHLESELRTTRGRLQDALAAEARATAAEQTARERLEASAAERDAAVERTRATCEAHYTVARRRLESQLNIEHERLLCHFKQEAALAREETANYRNELERVNAFLQEAKEATSQAVELTLAESLKEREKERIQFWREELPRQIEQAKRSWMKDADARATLEADRVRSSCQAEFEALMANYMKEHQAELERLRRPKSTCDKSIDCPPEVSMHLVNADAFPLVSALTSDSLFMQMASIPDVAPLLPFIEANLRVLLSDFAQSLMQQAVDTISTSLLEAISEYDVLKDHHGALKEKLLRKRPQSSVVKAVLDMENDFISADLSTEVAIIRKLARGFAGLKEKENGSKHSEAEKQAIHQDIISKIRGEVQTYVESCQERCAKVLEAGLVRAHRHACRLLSLRLRNAFLQSDFPHRSGLSDNTRAPSVHHSMGLSKSQLESLLDIIDAVCASTEMFFSETSFQGRPTLSSFLVFPQNSHEAPPPNSTSIPESSAQTPNTEAQAVAASKPKSQPLSLDRASSTVGPNSGQSTFEAPVPPPRIRSKRL